MNKFRVINIVSGKGGTGKTLLSATLAELIGNQGKSVLVVDLDIFVRGLTALLYFHQGESLKLIKEKKYTVSDIFIQKFSNKKVELGIKRYRSFDVIPSVPSIDILLNFNDIFPDNYDEASSFLQTILNSIPHQYDFVLLDSRAGFDELIAATHELSDFSICIQEEDPISNITAENLVRQLEKNKNSKVFRIINKARGISNIDDLNKMQRKEFSFIGTIPFDKDVLNSFGEKTFWRDISKSLYISAASKAWNRLSNMMDLELKLPEPRISPFGNEKIESRIGILSISSRISFILGLFISILGFIIGFVGSDIFDVFKENPTRTIAFTIGLMGLMIALLSVIMEGFPKRK